MSARLLLLLSVVSGAPLPGADAGTTPASDESSPSTIAARRKRLAKAESYLTSIHEKELCRGSGKPLRDFVQLCAEIRVELPLVKEGLHKAHVELDAMQRQAEVDGGVTQSRAEREAQERLVDGLIERNMGRIDLLYKSIPGGD